MLLYSKTGATAVDDPATGAHYEPGPDGAFSLPEPFGMALHAFHSAGKRLWETVGERAERLVAEETARRQSPEALLDAVNKLVEAAGAVHAGTPAPPAAPVPEPEPPAAKGKAKAADTPAEGETTGA